MHPILPLRQPHPAAPRAEALGLAVAFCRESGMTEVEALRDLHAALLGRAAALHLRLDGEAE